MLDWTLEPGSLSDTEVAELLLSLEIGAADGDSSGVELLSRWINEGSASSPISTGTDQYTNHTCDARIVNGSLFSDEKLSCRKRRKLSEDSSIAEGSIEKSIQACSGMS